MVIIGNAAVLTLDKEKPLLHDGAVTMEKHIVKELGNTREIRQKYPEAEFMDAGGRLVMPGFLNCHMHLYSTFARGMALKGAPPASFGQILEKLWWKMDRLLSKEEEIYYSALVPLIEGIKCGTTGILDHHASFGLVDGCLDILERAAEDAGVRAVLCYETSDRWGKELRDASIRENVRFIHKMRGKNQDQADSIYNKDSLVAATFGLHASLTLSDETLEKCAAEAQSLGAGFHIHVAEGIEDVEDSLKKSGKRVVERLNSFGILGDRTLAIHCVHVDENEMEILRDTGTMVVHNPQSNMNNAVGISPMLDFFKKEILTGLGTDGYTPSMFESAKSAYVLHKLAQRDPRVGGEETRRMLFENNSRIFGRLFEKPVGVIKPGALADIIILDYYPPTPLSEGNLFYHLIFGMRENMVSTAIVGGKIVMKDHQLTELDEEKIMAKSRELAAKFWRKMEDA
ncbi:putative aminohydrolase SsnA [Biomaibacter acetigenes]|jgi:putative selenium metabolism protein SsnA|uniref:Putative aminohydrolase SsnA n=1 Tax=Biomaibacter acetigenes TaxID=2316383 RepID=A0A3G2R2G0_9FIRM|nr:putative aminohydrolase SsnA [Biomaibacter acetigenes]AYO29237.1 putative aminohydrolase SsnA [Biomaibacter acetigenes]MDN5301662.1 hypothetical protein [Thermoanaerobacteraceae bacterium]RKL64556.1 putative aminohydrolase SsnA [Thermoanaerobacteraceae bacterium SP2]